MTAALVRLNNRTFSSFRYRNYRLFFAGQTVSQIGSWMQRIALGWFVFQLTHSAFAVGVMALATFLPFTLFGLFAGVLADRLDARRTVIATQAGQLITASALACDRHRRDRAAVDALRDRVRDRLRARARRPVPPAAHIPDGGPRGPAECDRAQLEPVQRVTRVRPRGRGPALRIHRRRRLLPRQRDQLPRRAAQPVRDADARLLPAREVRAPGDLARHPRGTRVRPAPAADARRARADGRAQHVRVQLQRHAAGARGPDAEHERAGVRNPVGAVRRRRARRRARCGVARPRLDAGPADRRSSSSPDRSCCSLR